MVMQGVQDYDSLVGETGRDGIAVLDTHGDICYLNAAWKRLIGSRDAEAFRIGNNYLTVLQALFEPGNTYVQEITRGVQAVLEGVNDYVELEYPYARSGRWHFFRLRLIAHPVQGARGVIVQQFDINDIPQTRAVGE
jgi:PAS domain-containing protein